MLGKFSYKSSTYKKLNFAPHIKSATKTLFCKALQLDEKQKQKQNKICRQVEM